MSKSSLFLLAVLLVSAARGAVDFNCTYSTGGWLVIVHDVYGCVAQVTITGDSQLLGSVQGTHESGKTNEDVEALYISSQNLPFIPGNISSFFKNIIVLEWFRSNLTTISSADLEPFPNLLVFSAWANNLVSIDGNLFQHTKLLRFVRFDLEQIQHVGHDLVKDLNDLGTLHFGNNPCVSQRAYSRTAVLLLNDQLPVLCPPLETTTTTTTTMTSTTTTESPQECPIACQDRIESFEIEISELNERYAIQSRKIADLNEKIVNQDATINNLNERNVNQDAKISEQSNEIKQLTERLFEVERKVRELASIP